MDTDNTVSNNNPSRYEIGTLMAMYLLTGAVSPAIIDFLRISGATSDYPPTLIPMLANTLGMALVGQFKHHSNRLQQQYSSSSSMQSPSMFGCRGGGNGSGSSSTHGSLLNVKSFFSSSSGSLVGSSSSSSMNHGKLRNGLAADPVDPSTTSTSSSGTSATTPTMMYSKDSDDPTAIQSADKRNKSDRVSLAITKATIIDFLSNVMTTAGLLWTGSGTFSVIASSGVAWTAIICHFLGQKLSITQKAGIALVTLGLVLNGIGSLRVFAHGDTFSAAAEDEDASVPHRNEIVLSENDLAAASSQESNFSFSPPTFFLGCVLVLLGTILHSAMFVFCEAQLKFHTVDRFQLCGTMGTSEFFALLTWNAVLSTLWGGPYNLYIRPIEERATTPEFNLFLITSLTLCNALHAYSFFSMLDRMGAISMGILKGVLSVSVFAIASLLYCSVESAQCVTFMKSTSLFMVIGGSILYSSAAKPGSVMDFSPRASRRAQIV